MSPPAAALLPVWVLHASEGEKPSCSETGPYLKEARAASEERPRFARRRSHFSTYQRRRPRADSPENSHHIRRVFPARQRRGVSMKSSKRTKPLPPFFLPPNLLEVRENGTEEEFVELLQPHIRYMARASKAGAIAGCRAAAAAVVAPVATSPRPFTASSRPAFPATNCITRGSWKAGSICGSRGGLSRCRRRGGRLSDEGAPAGKVGNHALTLHPSSK
jgi:hypothetical protein